MKPSVFGGEDNNITGFFTDLIVSRWRNGEIPMKLGEYPIDLKLPQGWYQILNGNLIYPSNMTAKVRVVGYLAEMKGKVEQYRLKEADTDEIEKFHLQADFDVLNNVIKSSHDEPIFTEEELKNLKKDAIASLENRVRLPKIFVRDGELKTEMSGAMDSYADASTVWGIKIDRHNLY